MSPALAGGFLTTSAICKEGCLTLLYLACKSVVPNQGLVSQKTMFPRTGVGRCGGAGRDGFQMIQAHLLCTCFYYYLTVIYDGVITQPTVMQNQWKP